MYNYSTLLYFTLLIHMNVILRIHTSYITSLLQVSNVIHRGNTVVLQGMHIGMHTFCDCEGC